MLKFCSQNVIWKIYKSIQNYKNHLLCGILRKDQSIPTRKRYNKPEYFTFFYTKFKNNFELWCKTHRII